MLHQHSLACGQFPRSKWHLDGGVYLEFRITQRLRKSLDQIEGLFFLASNSGASQTSFALELAQAAATHAKSEPRRCQPKNG